MSLSKLEVSVGESDAKVIVDEGAGQVLMMNTPGERAVISLDPELGEATVAVLDKYLAKQKDRSPTGMQNKTLNVEAFNEWAEQKEIEFAAQTVRIGIEIKRLAISTNVAGTTFRVCLGEKVIYDGTKLEAAINKYNIESCR